MKNLGKFYKSQNYVRPAFLLVSTLLVLSGGGVPSAASAQDTTSAQTTTSSQKVQLMFVQIAEDLKVDTAAKTLRLVNVNQQTLYFSDRPQRVAGHLTMPAYLDEWKAGEGPDNFTSDPPNATLSVYEPGQQENKLVVVEISHPVVDGKDLVYKYKLIEGKMPKSGGATALFIDWIGAGGGAGPGFHGVGAGTRGVGLTGGYGGPLR